VVVQGVQQRGVVALGRGQAHPVLGEFRDVVHQHIEALHLAVDDVGQVVRQGVLNAPAVGLRKEALEGLALASQGAFRMGAVALEEFVADHLAHPAAVQAGRVEAEPARVGSVGDPVDEVLVPVADHRRHGIEDGPQVVQRRVEQRGAFGHLPLQSRVEVDQRLPHAQRFTDVAHRLGETDASAVVADEGRHGDRHIHQAAIAPSPRGLEGREAVAADDGGADGGVLVGAVRRQQQLGHRASQGRFARVAEQLLGAAVPVGHDAVERHPDHRVGRVLDDRGMAGLCRAHQPRSLRALRVDHGQQRQQQREGRAGFGDVARVGLVEPGPEHGGGPGLRHPGAAVDRNLHLPDQAPGRRLVAAGRFEEIARVGGRLVPHGEGEGPLPMMDLLEHLVDDQGRERPAVGGGLACAGVLRHLAGPVDRQHQEEGALGISGRLHQRDGLGQHRGAGSHRGFGGGAPIRFGGDVQPDGVPVAVDRFEVLDDKALASVGCELAN